MKAVFSIVMMFLLFSGVASAGTYEDVVRARFEQTDLLTSPPVRARVQELSDDGYTQAGDVKVVYLQTVDCTPACRSTFLVAQSYAGTSGQRPTSKPLIAIYDLVVTAGQITEYYPSLVKVPSAEEVSQIFSLID